MGLFGRPKFYHLVSRLGNSTSPCNSSDSSRSTQGTDDVSLFLKASFVLRRSSTPPFYRRLLMNTLTAGQGIYLSLRASLLAEYSIGFIGAETSHIGSSNATTPGEDDICDDGIAFEASAATSVVLTVLGYASSSNGNNMLRTRQTAPFWLKVNGLWTYDLGPTAVQSATLAGKHWVDRTKNTYKALVDSICGSVRRRRL
ncbi:hypothetical protein BT69DRAFT_1296892 [Atractiella rhizophila]|nr:hypothetical protein BT69DRAFT_1296892 [Atractiella rhizophila]